MKDNIKVRIAMLSEISEVIDNIDTSIANYERWADEYGKESEIGKSYLETAEVKSRVRAMIAKLSESV